MNDLIAVRFVHFTALLLAAGTIWFPLASGSLPPLLQRRLRGLTAGALAVTALSGAAWLTLTAIDILGAPLADIISQGGIWTVIADTRFGEVAGVRIVLALFIAALLPWPATRGLQSLLAVVMVALPALTGHAGAMPGAAGVSAVAADMVHLVAAAAWLGGIPALIAVLASTTPGEVAARATRRFGALALVAVVVITGSGLLNAWHLLEGPSDLVQTAYGRLLSVKLALFAAMLALAALNRFRFTPALPADAPRRALMRSAAAETALGFGVLLVVAALGIQPPGGHTHSGGVPPEAAFVHIHDAQAMAEITINPGRVGSATATIRVMREDMSELPASDVRLALAAPGNAARPSSEHVAVRQSDGVWRIDGVAVSRAGTWTIRLTVTPADGSAFVLDAPIVIEP